jgi:hypothetical protein
VVSQWYVILHGLIPMPGFGGAIARMALDQVCSAVCGGWNVVCIHRIYKRMYTHTHAHTHMHHQGVFAGCFLMTFLTCLFTLEKPLNEVMRVYL